MNETIHEAREEMSSNAPRIHLMTIDPEKVGTLIGSGGKTIRSIEESTGASVAVLDGSKGEVVFLQKMEIS